MLFGEITYIFLLKEIKSYKILMEEKIKNKKDIINNRINISVCFLSIVCAIFLNNYVNGNIFCFTQGKNKVFDYIELNYETKDYKLMSANYNNNGYIFKIEYINKNDDKVYNFIYKNDKIIDGYMQTLLDEKNIELKNKFSKIDLSKYTNYNISLKVNDLNDNITMYIDAVDDMNTYVNTVNNILKEIYYLNDFKNINKLTLSLNDNNKKYQTDIYKINFFDVKYYLESLNVEYIG